MNHTMQHITPQSFQCFPAKTTMNHRVGCLKLLAASSQQQMQQHKVNSCLSEIKKNALLRLTKLAFYSSMLQWYSFSTAGIILVQKRQ